MSVTERSMFVAERSRNLKVQNSKPEIRNKNLEFRSRKFANWESQVSKCSLTRENALKMQALSDFLKSPAPPKLPIRTYVGMWSARQSAGVLCFFQAKKR